MYPVHRPADQDLNRLEDRLEQVFERIQQRRNNVVNGLPYSCDDRPVRIQHRADRCINGVPYRRDDKADQLDLLRNGVVYRCPDANKKVLDGSPDVREKGLDVVQYTGNKSGDAVPDIHKEILDRRPDIYPEFLYLTETCAEQIAQHIHIIFLCCFQGVPDRNENALDAVPDLAPVAGKDTDKDIQHIQDHVRHDLEDVSDLLEYTLKNRFQELA